MFFSCFRSFWVWGVIARVCEFHARGLRTNSWYTNGDSHSRVHDLRIGNSSVVDPRIKDASANNSNGSKIKWCYKDPRTFLGPKNQWDLEDWKNIEGLRIWAKFEGLQRRNLHEHRTVCQREVHEHGD